GRQRGARVRRLPRGGAAHRTAAPRGPGARGGPIRGEQPMNERKMDLTKIERGVRLILEGIGEDPERPGIVDTPRRVARMYEEICEGLHKDPREFIKVVPDETHDEMVIVKDIALYSICEHHMVPFHGVAHIAYIPDGGRILGLSKLARVVDRFARRP